MLMSDYVKKVEIRREDYGQIVSQVKGYANGKVERGTVDQDQPPQGARFPAWVREAEGVALTSPLMLEEESKGTEAKI